MMPEPRIGFLGIGIMGEAMVLRLLERGRPVTVWNLEPERLDRVVPHGAVAAPTPAAVAAASDVVILCVLHTDAVARCVFGPDGIASAGLAAGRVLLDHSTAEPAATREMAARLRAETGMGWVDAPVSGGPQAARAGTLTIMMGGDPGEIATLGPVLRDLGTNVTRMGPVGAGQTTKVLNQAIVGTGFVLMAEALAMAEAAGLDAAALPAGLAGGHADGSLLQKIYAQMQRRDFEPPTSYARQLLKDLKAVKAFAHDLDLELPLVETAVSRFADYVARGNEMVDSASVIRLYRPDP
jgi:3-hydroxyisobutyrate dehydrogenase